LPVLLLRVKADLRARMFKVSVIPSSTSDILDRPAQSAVPVCCLSLVHLCWTSIVLQKSFVWTETIVSAVAAMIRISVSSIADLVGRLYKRPSAKPILPLHAVTRGALSRMSFRKVLCGTYAGLSCRGITLSCFGCQLVQNRNLLIAAAAAIQW
jgi:hypothetical protein